MAMQRSKNIRSRFYEKQRLLWPVQFSNEKVPPRLCRHWQSAAKDPRNSDRNFCKISDRFCFKIEFIFMVFTTIPSNLLPIAAIND